MNTDEAALGPGDPMRYLRYAIGPPRQAPKEGKGWMFAAGELAMTARDLARVGHLDDRSDDSQAGVVPDDADEHAAEERRSPPATGSACRSAHRLGDDVVSHTGEVSGFTAANQIYPDDRAAVVVLTNLDATGASSQLAGRIATLLFGATSPDNAAAAALAQAKTVFEGLQRGRIDRALFTSNANAYFTEAALADFASGLGPLGPPQEFEQANQSLRGGMVARSFRIKCAAKTLRLTTFTMPDGKLEQYQIAAAE